MSWLERVSRPSPPATTTVILYRNDLHEPVIFNLRGLRRGVALRGLLVSLVQEHYCEGLEPEAEILWQDKGVVEAAEVRLVFDVRRL